MSIKKVMKGDFLGCCDQKGYLYSVFTGYSREGKYIYQIYAVKDGEPTFLLEFTAERQQRNVDSIAV